MSNNNIRQNFYQGQKIVAKNLNSLQDYSDKNNNLIVSDLLGYGILHGFEIQQTDNFLITIDPGVAFDTNGVRLILENSTPIDLMPLKSNIETQTILLGIKGSYILSNPVNDSLGNEIYTSFAPSVEFITGETLDKDTFILASIILTSSSIIEIKTTAVKFQNLQKQIEKTHSFSTEKSSKSTIANIDADIFNINKKSFADTIRDMAYPIKSTYTQYPDETTGSFDETETPRSLFGGDWEQLFTDKGIFFRTEGGLSAENRDVSTGIQLDSMQKLTGKLKTRTTNAGSFYLGVEGIFTSSASSLRSGCVQEGNARESIDTNFDNSRQARTSTENRSINMLMKIWKRIG